MSKNKSKITKERFNKGTGGVWRLTAPESEREALEEAVKELIASIDPYASPVRGAWGRKDGYIFMDVDYYGLD